MITDEMLYRQLDDWESLCREDKRLSPTTSLRLIAEVRRLRALQDTFRPGREADAVCQGDEPQAPSLRALMADDSWRVGF